MEGLFERFHNITHIDFEYRITSGNKPEVRCAVLVDHKSKAVKRYWVDELPKASPYSDNDLMVAYYAPAELSCFEQLGWEQPKNVVDLFAEHRVLSNGLTPKSSLLEALSFWNLKGIGAEEKASMRDLALRPGCNYTVEEKEMLLDYCQSDVDAMLPLIEKMAPHINLDQALYRGEYMKSVSKMESNGLPIDTNLFEEISKNETALQKKLVSKVNKDFNVFDGTSFRTKLFENYLVEHRIPWPQLASGRLCLKEETFSQQSKIHPQLYPLHQMRQLKRKATVSKIAVGTDGRNRTMLSPFRSKTGRNQPSGNKFIFNCSSWTRGLVKPTRGSAIAYIDYSQQEIGIAAALSKDKNMIQAYESGDPYLAFGKQAGLIPESATKQTHKKEREQFKACVLAMQYGMGEDTFSNHIQQPKRKARQLIEIHKKTFSTFWDWSDSVVDFARQHGFLETSLGWHIHIDGKSSENSIRNFMMQAHGAEILRLACIFIVDSGVKLCAPIHDAVLIESTLEKIDRDILTTQKAMREAGEVILDGITLSTDSEKIEYPDRYMDSRGKPMWDQVMEAIAEL